MPAQQPASLRLSGVTLPIRWLCCIVVIGVLGGCPQSQLPQDTRCKLVTDGFGPAGKVEIKVEKVASGLEVPWGVAFLPNGGLLITERKGRVRLVREGLLEDASVAEIKVSARGEGGLLGIALHPQFRFGDNPGSNRYFYLYYTADKGDQVVNRVERHILNQDGDKATLDKIIFDDIPSAQFHNGGRIRFGPDGMLYIGTGDARQPDLAQDPKSLAGKLLRLTPEGTIPADNPTPGQAAYLTGIRNTQGFDWLRKDLLVVTDHGPSGELGRRDHDEVSIATPGSNLGWPTIFGCQASQDLISPQLSWVKAAPPGGAALYTGNAIPAWKDSLLIGSLGAKHLQRVVFSNETTPTITQHEVYLEGDPPAGFGRLREVIMGPDGHLYVTTSNCDGRGNCPPDKDALLRITQ